MKLKVGTIIKTLIDIDVDVDKNVQIELLALKRLKTSRRKNNNIKRKPCYKILYDNCHIFLLEAESP